MVNHSKPLFDFLRKNVIINYKNKKRKEIKNMDISVIREMIECTNLDYNNKEIENIKEQIHKKLDNVFENIYEEVSYLCPDEYLDQYEEEMDTTGINPFIGELIEECMFEQGKSKFWKVMESIEERIKTLSKSA